jgi:hypothetical protein
VTFEKLPKIAKIAKKIEWLPFLNRLSYKAEILRQKMSDIRPPCHTAAAA